MPRRVLTIRRRPLARPLRGMFAPTSFAEQPLPDGLAIDPRSDEVVGKILDLLARKPAWLNISGYSAARVIVGPDQAFVPVTRRDVDPGNTLAIVLRLYGLPIPDGFVLQNDTDGAASFIQVDKLAAPGIAAPDAKVIFVGEAWQLRRAADGTYSCSSGGRITNPQQNPGHYVTQGYWRGNPGVPERSKQETWFGVPASGNPMEVGMVNRVDLERGWMDHPLSFSLPRWSIPADRRPDGSAKTFRWPATREDSPGEGMRFFLPRDTPIDPAWPRGLKTMVEGAKSHGLIYNDTHDNATAVAVRWEPGTEEFRDGNSNSQLLKKFPWSRIRLMREGSDAVPNVLA